MVAGGVGVGRDRRPLGEPAVDRADQVRPGRVLARLHHGLDERVGNRLAIEHVAIERRLRVVLVVDLFEQRDPAVAGVTEGGQVAVGDDPLCERVTRDRRAALLGEGLQQPAERHRVGAHVAGHQRGAEAELEAGQLEQGVEGRDRERHHDLGAGRLQRGDLRPDVDVGRHVALPAHDLRMRDLVVEPLHAVLPELVVLEEVADLLTGEVLLDVGAEDLPLADVVKLPAKRLRVLGRVVPAVAAGRDEDVGHFLGVEEADRRQVRGGAQAVEDRVHVVLQDQLVDVADGLGRVVAVVEIGVLDLAAVHTAVGVDVLEVRVGRGRDLAVAGCGRAGERLVAADEDLGRGDARRGRGGRTGGRGRRRTAAAGGYHRGGHRGGGDGGCAQPV